MMRLCSLSLVFVLALVSSAEAQRAVPPASDPAPFVEQADPGAFGNFQILALDGVDLFTNPYDGTLAVGGKKATSDVLVYDRASGSALMVRTKPAPYSVALVFECFEWVTLRAGMTWTPAHLDGDGRQDLIGHDARTGEVVRVYQRGLAQACR